MDNIQQCLIFNNIVSGTHENEIPEKIKELVHEKNTHGLKKCEALQALGIDNIVDCVAGPNSVAFLLKNGSVVRIGEHAKSTHSTSAVSATAPAQSANQASNTSLSRSTSAKFRRVMLSSSFRRTDRGGLLIDRGRPVLPASAVPEEMIAQAQVVLQGKSREVIIRELQRTNLNVNEAVNNLLSRDDDEDDGEEGGSEVMLPEELLSLLDPSSSHPLLAESDYNDGFEYVLNREISRRRGEKGLIDKDKKPKEIEDPTVPRQQELDDGIQYWSVTGKGTPDSVSEFIKIVGTGTELLALSSTGELYAWNWAHSHGENEPHSIAKRLVHEPIVDMSASRLRVVVLTRNNCLASWVDHNVLGQRVCQALEVKPCHLALHGDESIVELCSSTQLAIARTSANAFFWCGLYPYSDRPKMWEKERAKTRKHVTFETTGSEIKEGTEVRTKASPIYAAGSIGVNLSLPTPMVGVLMESVWTLAEVCRFRILDSSTYDSDIVIDSETSEKTSLSGESRKRRASQAFPNEPDPAMAPSSSATREEPWSISDVVWIHEQQTTDTAIAKLVDGQYVVVEYVPSSIDFTFATSQSTSLGMKDSMAASGTNKTRILRKEDLVVVTPKMKASRSPRVMQKDPTRFVISGSSSRKVISAVADSTGIRALTEKRSRIFVTRCSINGKVMSDHFLPVYPAALFGPNGTSPSLVNYGEDSVLFLKDGSGSLTPLVRDASMGFREPITLHLPPIRHCDLHVVPYQPSGAQKSSSQRKISLVVISGPSNAASMAVLPSLMQHILFANTEGVKKLLDKLQDIGDYALIRTEVLDERSDGGANILHTAIRLAVAAKNKDDADPGTTHGIRLREDETRMAREEARDLDQRWQRLIRANRLGPPGDKPPELVRPEWRVENQPEAHVKAEPGEPPKAPEPSNEPVPSTSEPNFGEPVADTKARQQGAIDIVKTIVDHPCVESLIPQLLAHRDFGGLTPFQAAINNRAYGAALHIWIAIRKACEKDASLMQSMIHPIGSRPDDSPLFLLCYNDTCSFTWTGEQHINQDIFECRTCGLTGSLCCCTECALTCHRNHDCKLKRTSPTAYCDCWEKCPCKALISGNQEKRELLLQELLKYTNLHESTNNRGEHLMLFLVRTWGRQQTEQSNSARRRRHPAGTHSENPNVPENDLDPPKFAKFALDTCLGEWNVIKSLIRIGIRDVANLPPVLEEILCLHSQNGSTHLDKFVFTLLVKCGDQPLDKLVNTLIVAANLKGKPRDIEVDSVISRFVRSLLRVYTLIVLLSPSAASVAVRGKSTQPPSSGQQKMQAVSVTGFFSIVRNEPSHKDGKAHSQNVASVIMRCRNSLMRLPTYAILQSVYVADALLAPVRIGIVRPVAALSLGHNQDALEVIEKFLNGEHDLTSHLAKTEEARERTSRRKKVRNDIDRDDSEGRREDSDSEYESEDGVSSRRIDSQGASGDSAPNTEAMKNRIPAYRGRDEYVFVDDVESDSSSSRSESEDDEEGHVIVDDDDNIDDEEEMAEEDDREEPYGDTSEGDHDGDVSNSYMMGNSAVHENDHDDNSGDGEPGDMQDVQMYDADSEVREDERMDEPVANDEDDRQPDGHDHLESQNRDIEDEENTRDAIHSEASSAEGGDMDEGDGQPVRNDSTVDMELSAVMDGLRPPSGRSSNRRTSTSNSGRRVNALSWATRNRNLWSDNAPSTDREPRSSSTVIGANSRRSKEDMAPSQNQTSRQLAIAFNLIIRLIGDLMRRIGEPSDKPIHLKYTIDTTQTVTEKIMQRLDVIWNWMAAALDRTEAQLLFGNAIMSAAGDLSKPQKSKKKDSSGNGKKEKTPEEIAAHNSRRDTLEYIMSTMRAQSGEAGDDYPLVDLTALKTMAFVFDAHILFREIFAENRGQLLKNVATFTATEGKSRFFQRSNSLCFPGSTITDAWDTLDKNGSQVPLAERNHLLSSDACSHSLFAPPPLPITWNKYKEHCSNLAIKHPLNMGFAQPVGKSDDDFNPEVDYEDVPNDAIMDDDEVPEGMEATSIEAMRHQLKTSVNSPLNASLARWKNVLQCIAKECHRDLLAAYGGENEGSHLLTTVAGFPVRQALFRKLMDKYRGIMQGNKDVVFNVHRDPVQLVKDAIYQLNHLFVRRQNEPKTSEEPLVAQTPTLCASRVKVKFHDEPGEGSGVARSFYTAFAEALHSLKKFPFDELGWDSDEYMFGNTASSPPTPQPPATQSTTSSRDRSGVSRIALIRDRGTTSAILSRKRTVKRYPLSINALPYTVEDIPAAEQRFAAGQYKTERPGEDPTRDRPTIAEAIYLKVRSMRPNAASRIVGILVDIPVNTALGMLGNSETLKLYVDDAIGLLLQSGTPTDLAMLSQQEEKITQGPSQTGNDDAPLFARTSKRGFYAPVPGKLSPMRLNAFRNIGRIIGICLSQNELFPLKLTRHVLKFILGRPLCWLDLQFHDPQLFESLRQLLDTENSEDLYESLMLRFTADIHFDDPSQPPETIELKPGGSEIDVTRQNVVEYIYCYVNAIMIGSKHRQCLEAIRLGVSETVPLDSFKNLTAEDLRLLMCGNETMCFSGLQSVTTFSDESHSTGETLEKFKQWFWSVLENLSQTEKQDLIFFWTGSPSLPTTAEALQPQPSVVVRPQDDLFLPTANTCISRLYVPLYSSKKLLRSKLQMAIKSKDFGFV